jgi:Family of unknown function (DUF6931)
MLEVFDPSVSSSAKSYVGSFELSDDALARLESGQNVRGFLDRLIGDGLTSDALTIIARSLPMQMMVAWCCECLRSGWGGARPGIEVERAAVALAEQCLKDPSDENRQLCLEFAERGKRATAGAWLATAAAWADGPLTKPDDPVTVEAPVEAVAGAVVAALSLSATQGGGDASARLASYATRALTLFGPRATRPT